MSAIDPMSMAFSSATVVLFILFLVVVYVRFIRPRSRGASTASAKPASNKVEPKPKKGGAPEVQIVTNGPAGTIYYFEQGHTLKLYWEFGGGDAVAIVYAPSEEKWDAQAPWVQGRRKEILEFVAKQVIQQKAPGCSVRWSAEYFELVKK